MWGWKQRRDALAAASAAKLRRVLQAWRSYAAADEAAAVSAFRSAAASARQLGAFWAWLAAMREQAAAAAAFRHVSQARRSAGLMRAWLGLARSRAARRASVRHVSDRRDAAMLAAVLKHWRLLAERSCRAAALSEKAQRRLAKRALRAWQRTAERSRQLQVASKRMAGVAANIRAAKSLMAWRSVRSMSHALSAFQRQHAARLAKHALHAWLVHAAHAGHVRSAAASLAALTSVRLMRQAFDELRAHASSCRSAKDFAKKHAGISSAQSLPSISEPRSSCRASVQRGSSGGGPSTLLQRRQKLLSAVPHRGRCSF